MNHRRLDLDINKLGPPWMGLWMTHMVKAISKSGGDTNAATQLHQWITDNPMFEDVVYREFWLPAVPVRRETPNDSEYLRRIDKNLYEDCLVSLVNFRFFPHSHIHVPGLHSGWSSSPFGIWFCTGNHQPDREEYPRGA